MFRAALCVSLLIIALPARAADREVKGTLVEINVEDRALVIERDDGKKWEYVIRQNSRVHDGRAVSRQGFRDVRLKPGTPVRLTLPEKGTTIKQLTILPAGEAPPGKEGAPGVGARRADASGGGGAAGQKIDPPRPRGVAGLGGGGAAESNPPRNNDNRGGQGAGGGDAARPGQRPGDAPAKPDEDKAAPAGLLARILRLDKEQRTLEVELVDTKKKETYTLDKDVEFVGPRGGLSEDGLDDERLTPGHQVRVELNDVGTKVLRLHLSNRRPENNPKR